VTAAKFTIRDLLPVDIDELLNLEQQTPGAPHWSRSEYENLFAAGDALSRRGIAAIAENIVAGFAIVKILSTFGHCEAELETIVVRSDSQRRGIGGALMQALIERLETRGVTEIRLEVRPSNAAAIWLYKSCGFDQTGVRKRYYDDPQEDAVLMEWRTSPR
jgi:ribosomal-protein-alanine N-acetyltransferase